MMEHRRLGRSELMVSAVGFGTLQLPLVPEAQAIDTLLRGFELGVNVVHTGPEYGCAEERVAAAVARWGKPVIVASQGHDVASDGRGRVRRFEALFEATCARLRTDRLELYGIACIEHRELFGENVWGPDGMVEFLLRKKEQGRLGAIFCTTHGAPDYLKKLVTSGVFDALMLAYNVLGYHLLSCFPTPGQQFEAMAATEREILPLCRQHGVGVMVMKPLGGGLLCRSDAHPPRGVEWAPRRTLRAADFLQPLLRHPEVTCVLPGTASVAEADENARCGHGPAAPTERKRSAVAAFVGALSRTVCSRCGACEPLCSRGLRVSWLFRAALIHLYPSAALEPIDGWDYFDLHPGLEVECAQCTNRTCACPSGIDIPAALTDVHQRMTDLLKRGLVPPPPAMAPRPLGEGGFAARVLALDVPAQLPPGGTYVGRLTVQNAGTLPWRQAATKEEGGVSLVVSAGGKQVLSVPPWEDVQPSRRYNFTFELCAPAEPGPWRVDLQLLRQCSATAGAAGLELVCRDVAVGPSVGTARSTRWPALPGWALAAARLVAGSSPRAEPSRGAAARWADGSEERAGEPPFAPPCAPVQAAAPRPEYAVAWLENNLPASFPKGGRIQAYVQVENQGTRTWLARHPTDDAVHLAVHLGDQLHTIVRIPHDVPPDTGVVLSFPFTFPDSAAPGGWKFTLSFVELNVAWFGDKGVAPLEVSVRAEEAEEGASARALAQARQSNCEFWLPSQGIARGRDGRRYPLFVREARGCRVRDAEGNEWIDYVMCGGAALLGYAHPAIQQALRENLGSSALITLPHLLEVEVARLLCESIPCAETVLFGKHGSDACTAAIRVARVHTGRKKVLYGGYHGWHDWYAGVLAPELSPSEADPLLYRFAPDDLAGLHALVSEHAGQIAAVILEPAACFEGLEGPVRDADPAFLAALVETCRREGIVTIFDEIVTGFRHPQGSVQRATGVVPDLTCLGKALSAGMPLSALVGRRALMEQCSRIAYVPTFRGETLSLAAAQAALGIYATRDVPGEIQAFGSELKGAVNRLSGELGIGGEMIGPAFRLLYRFHEPDALRLVQKRTLLQQELLKNGVLTFKGLMLPSSAHGPREIEQTLAAFRAALLVVLEAASSGRYARYLEIPYV